MERRTFSPRTDWQSRVESQGLTFHSLPDVYWNETVGYAFTSREVDELEDAGNAVHKLCLSAAQHIIDKDLFHRLAIPDSAAKLIVDSWNKRDPHLYGRFDFVYDGTGKPKMLEYNADTPTSLLEASVIQWHWLQDRFSYRDQFNSIHEKLVARWKEIKTPNRVHVSTLDGIEEDVLTVHYLADTAREAGLDARYIGLESIGYNPATQRFCDEQDQNIDCLFKLYPWEWMIKEDFAKYLPESKTRMIEPAWKMLWSNKGILPILWEMAPNHPNLLPAYATPDRLGDSWVRKPLLSREGQNVTIHRGGEHIEKEGIYGAEGHIYQAYQKIPSFDGRYPILGVWMVGDNCCGMGIRESDDEVTDNVSRFTPHFMA